MNSARTTGSRGRKSQVVRASMVVVLCTALLIALAVWTRTGRPDPSEAPEAHEVQVFTFVATGIVFVDPATSDIVWKDTAKTERTIGEDPWRNPEKPRPYEGSGAAAWRDDREIVGNPVHDLVAWTETFEGTRGDLIVVRASTGEVLARTPIAAPTDRSVVIASVDDEVVYFATPDPTTGFPDMPGTDILMWRWATGEVPIPRGLIDRYYNDVSAGTWALYSRVGVDFLTEDGAMRATTNGSVEMPTDFGRALSPDGNYWYNAWDSQIVDTATGAVMTLPVARNLAYGWTGASELTLIGPHRVCSAVSGVCRGPFALPSQGVCAPYDVLCGNHLPAN